MTTVTWSEDAKKAFAMHLKLCSSLGFWPLLQADLSLKIRMFIVTTEMMIMTASNLYVTYRNCGDAEESLNNLLVVTSSVLCLSKLLAYYGYRKDLSVPIVSAIEDWSSIETIDYRSVMNDYKEFYIRVTFVVATAASCSAGLYALKRVVIDPASMIELENNDETNVNVTKYILQKKYIFPTTCTLINVSETSYRIIVINQFVQIVISTIIIAGCDGFFIAITTHLCGQFEILKMKFNSVTCDEKGSMLIATREKIKALVARHQHLLELIEHIENAYNKTVLIQMLISILNISVTGFGLIIAQKTRDSFGFVRSCQVILYMLLQSFMYTYIGEALQYQGDSVSQSVYDASWYNLPEYLSKDLILIMMRSNKSSGLTAGKFFYVTRSTFMSILKNSASYLSVLRIMLNE